MGNTQCCGRGEELIPRSATQTSFKQGGDRERFKAPPLAIKGKKLRKLTTEVDLHIIKEPINRYYKFGKIIGEGKFGIVRTATLIKLESIDSGPKFAVKSIKLKENTKLTQSALDEIKALRNLDHPNIVNVIEAYRDTEALHIVMELCKGQELFDYVLERKKLSEKKSSEIITEILKTLNYLHKRNVVHRDLKPENIIFDEST